MTASALGFRAWLNELPNRRGLDAFRVWLAVATLTAILLGLGAFVLYRVFNGPAWLMYLALWAAMGASESVMLFRTAIRRILWVTISAGIGIVLTSWPPSLLVVPLAAAESLVCWRIRRWPWIWALATMALHGTAYEWAPNLRTGALWLSNTMSTRFTVPMMDPMLAGMVAVLGVILLTRALVGSFICIPLAGAPVLRAEN